MSSIYKKIERILYGECLIRSEEINSNGFFGSKSSLSVCIRGESVILLAKTVFKYFGDARIIVEFNNIETARNWLLNILSHSEICNDVVINGVKIIDGSYSIGKEFIVLRQYSKKVTLSFGLLRSCLKAMSK